MNHPSPTRGVSAARGGSNRDVLAASLASFPALLANSATSSTPMALPTALLSLDRVSILETCGCLLTSCVGHQFLGLVLGAGGQLFRKGVVTPWHATPKALLPSLSTMTNHAAAISSITAAALLTY
jgi:hypothetical protein